MFLGGELWKEFDIANFSIKRFRATQAYYEFLLES